MFEDDTEEDYSIYYWEPSILVQNIGECFGFEYYVIDNNKYWLICENDHNVLFGLGQKLKENNLDRIRKSSKAQ